MGPALSSLATLYHSFSFHPLMKEMGKSFIPGRPVYTKARTCEPWICAHKIGI